MDSSVVSENPTRHEELNGQHETEELSDVESADGSMIEHPGTFQDIYSMSESPLFDYAPTEPDQVAMNGNAAFEESIGDQFSLDRFFKSPDGAQAQPLAPTLETPTPPKVEVKDEGPPSWNSFTNPLVGQAESPKQENGASSSFKSLLAQEKAGVSRASLIADVMSQNDISPGSSPASSPRNHYTLEKDSTPSVPVSLATPMLVPRLRLSSAEKEAEVEVESPRVANTPPNLKVPRSEPPSSSDSMSRPLTPKSPHNLTRKPLNGSTSPTVRAKPNVFDRLSAPSRPAPSRPNGEALSPKPDKKPASPRQTGNSGDREKALARLAAPKSPRASPTRIASPRRSGTCTLRALQTPPAVL
ncbi:hypothetical protein CYMTET_18432 [Cymbomonas tetramitiformis]|uniref:Uncharacterized protein n=1 Tax=Cymbomonas tetramitiformis TaxID=36881 RepID=A0AAE0L687_9CHLO|nr:hypothetical protein CYMTET_18432 [Cymbomonas tetramitiformis]